MFYIRCFNCDHIFSSAYSHDNVNFICPACGKSDRFESLKWKFYGRFDDWDEPVSRLIPFIDVCPHCNRITTFGRTYIRDGSIVTERMYCALCNNAFERRYKLIEEE